MTPVQLVRQMMDAAISAANPASLVRHSIQQLALPTSGRTFVVAVGKAAVAMAAAASATSAEILPPHTQAIIISKLPDDSSAVQSLPSTFQHFQAGHPVPDERSVAATQAVKRLLAQTTEDDVVLCLISGGASALLTDPQISLEQWRELNQALLYCGCSINEVNHVRQHVDAVKGGGLLKWAAPARVETLILSDVIGNNMAHIGSGPTVPTPRDVGKVRAIFEQYGVLEFVSEGAKDAIETHLRGLTTESVESAEGNEERVKNMIVGDVGRSLAAAAKVAEEAGLDVRVISAELTGEARLIGQQLAQQLIKMPAGSCYLYGGETTVTFEEATDGMGGRNQELALAAAIELDGHRNCWLATLATDGEDGPNDGAGAIVNGKTVAQAAAIGLDAADFLTRHDSYSFFKQLPDQHIRIGSTGTNVNDVTILLKSLSEELG